MADTKYSDEFKREVLALAVKVKNLGGMAMLTRSVTAVTARNRCF